MVELKEEIVKIINKRINLPHYKIFYFGSRVKGNADARSDIDIGIEAPQQIPLEVISEIRTEFDNLPVLQKIDIVDFTLVSEEFKKNASQDIEVIYEK